MSKVIPATISAVVLPAGRMQPNRKVRATDWENLAQGLHYIFRSKGTRCPGMVFYTPFATSSASYTQVNSSATNADHHLSAWEGAFRFGRLIYGTATAGHAYELTLDANMYNLDLRLTLERIEVSLTNSVTPTTLAITNTNSTDTEAISGAKEYAQADVYESGSTANDPAIFRLYLEARSKNGVNPGYLYNFAVRETRVVAANLPRA